MSCLSRILTPDLDSNSLLGFEDLPLLNVSVFAEGAVIKRDLVHDFDCFL